MFAHQHFNMKTLFSIVLLFISFIACHPQQDDRIKVIPASAFKIAIQEDVQLIDVRTSGEYKSGFIKNAINMDVTQSQFAEQIKTLDKSKPVYIYCRSGARSSTAAKQMIAAGFTEVIDLQGGILRWN